MQKEHATNSGPEATNDATYQGSSDVVVREKSLSPEEATGKPQRQAANAPSSTDALAGRRDDLGRKLETLGVASETSARAVRDASEGQLALLEQLAQRMAPPARPAQKQEAMSLEEYRSVANRLGEEYVGTLTAARLRAITDVGQAELQEGIEQIAEVSRLIRAIPPASRSAMWPAVRGEMDKTLVHYERLKRVLIETGVAAALDAEAHIALAELHRGMVPELDLMILRMAGEADPEAALLAYIRSARLAPATVLGATSVVQLLVESERRLQLALAEAKQAKAAAAPPPKRWTAWSKMFTGIATAGLNVASGVALWGVGGPLAAGATLGTVVASCATGIGAVAEGVGVLRGE